MQNKFSMIVSTAIVTAIIIFGGLYITKPNMFLGEFPTKDSGGQQKAAQQQVADHRAATDTSSKAQSDVLRSTVRQGDSNFQMALKGETAPKNGAAGTPRPPAGTEVAATDCSLLEAAAADIADLEAAIASAQEALDEAEETADQKREEAMGFETNISDMLRDLYDLPGVGEGSFNPQTQEFECGAVGFLNSDSNSYFSFLDIPVAQAAAGVNFTWGSITGLSDLATANSAFCISGASNVNNFTKALATLMRSAAYNDAVAGFNEANDAADAADNLAGQLANAIAGMTAELAQARQLLLALCAAFPLCPQCAK